MILHPIIRGVYMDYYEIIVKLIGPIEPVGETSTDNDRLENLIEMASIVNRLIGDIDKLIPYKNRTEYSIKQAGEYADNFLTSIGISPREMKD